MSIKRRCVICTDQIDSSEVKVTLKGQMASILLVHALNWPWSEGCQSSLHASARRYVDQMARILLVHEFMMIVGHVFVNSDIT